MNVVDGVARFVEVISNRFIFPAFNARKVFFEAGVKGASSFADVVFTGKIQCAFLLFWCPCDFGLMSKYEKQYEQEELDRVIIWVKSKTSCKKCQ